MKVISHLKSPSTVLRWLTIGLVTAAALSLFPDDSHAGCPYARRRPGIRPLDLSQPRDSATPLTIEVAASETSKNRCPKGQHIFKGKCLDNTVLDGLKVCDETNCTQDCAGCAKGTVSCFPRPDDSATYVCIDCKSNKNCRKGYLCDNYRCVPKTGTVPATQPGPVPQK